METAVTERVSPIVTSSARIIQRAANDLVGRAEDWPIVAAQVVLAQPTVAGAFEKAAAASLTRVRVLGLHQPRVWGVESGGLNIDHTRLIPDRTITQCVECHKSYPCPTVQAYGAEA